MSELQAASAPAGLLQAIPGGFLVPGRVRA